MKNKDDFLYQQIYTKMIQDITEGKIKAGTKLPSIRKYADENGISCNTVQNAYFQLLSEGYIYAKEKSGYFVSDFEADMFENYKKNPAKNKNTSDKNESSPLKKTAPQEKKAVLNLSANLTDGSVFPYATFRQLYREALNSKNDEILRQTGDFRGDLQFRQAIADYIYAHRNVKCQASQIILGGGTAALLQQLSSLFTAYYNSQKPVFLLEKPGYSKTAKIIEDFGCKTVYVPLDEDGADIQQIQNYKPETKGACILHITPSHQFPMGITMTIPRRSSVLKWAYESPYRYIIEDDYDSEFRYKGHSIPSLQGTDLQGKIIYTGTFSRTLTPAMRISYAVLPETLADFYTRNFSYYTCPVSRIEQQVLSVFIREGYFERHINRSKKMFRERRDKMINLLKQNFPQCRIQGEEAGLHFIVQLYPETKNQIEYEQRITEKSRQQELILNGTGNGWLIIGYAHLNEEEMKLAVKKLRETAEICL